MYETRSYVVNSEHLRKVISTSENNYKDFSTVDSIGKDDRVILTSDEKDARIFYYPKKYSIEKIKKHKNEKFVTEAEMAKINEDGHVETSREVKADTKGGIHPINFLKHVYNVDFYSKNINMIEALRALIANEKDKELGTFRLNKKFTRVIASPLTVQTDQDYVEKQFDEGSVNSKTKFDDPESKNEKRKKLMYKVPSKTDEILLELSDGHYHHTKFELGDKHD